MPGLEFIAGWIDAHHERPDGRGYPEMLSREEIPLAARILAIADSYWALRAERPHRPAYTREDAVDIIEANAGEQFDGSVVEWLVPALDALEQTPRRRRAS
jgi:HD-GYP domain-containing protein (c-di-GMP phosphodiesterase class II)